MKFNWTQYSQEEEQLSNAIVRFCIEQNSFNKNFNEILRSLSMALFSNESINCIAAHEIITKFPDLKNISSGQTFAVEDSALSASVFGCIAETYNLLKERHVEFGMVNTPPILAYDMVVLSINSYLDKILSISTLDSSVQNQHEAISKITFYDSCTGTGIFPLVFLIYLGENHLVDLYDFSKNLELNDIDSVSLEAALIRLSCCLSIYTKKSFSNSLRELAPSLHCKNSLLQGLRATQLSLFGDDNEYKGTKDIVVSNPPYVRPEKIPSDLKEILYELYPDIADGKADLYNYFIAHGVSHLSKNGVLCYITPASFQKGKYGSKTRVFLEDKVDVHYLFDFDENKVFKNVSLHSCVFLLSLRSNIPLLKYISFDRLELSHPLLNNLSHMEELPQSCANSTRWHFSDTESTDILEKMRLDSRKLINVVGKIYSGIKTGCNEAYILNNEEAYALKSFDFHIDLIVPVIIPKDLSSYCIKRPVSHSLLLMKKGIILNDDSLILKHLSKFKESLLKRSDLKKDDLWYNLRSCDYYEEFKKPKIIYPDISTECRFCLDLTGALIPDSSFFLPTNNLLLLGVLNSSLAMYYFREACNSIGNPNKKGRLRFKKTYVSDFPIPKETESNKLIIDRINDLVKININSKKNITEDEINNEVFKLYSLSKQEIEKVQKNIYGNSKQSNIHIELR